MKRLKESPISLSVIINLIIFIGLMLVFKPRFETSDDAYMNEFASGIFGERENHLVFINYILSSIIQCLYKILPVVNWYTMFQYISIFTSLLTITYVFIKMKGNTVGIGISVILATVFGYQGYVWPQFTKTAGYLVIAGAILVFFAFREQKHLCRNVCIGVLMMLFGAMYRESAFMLGLLMVFPIGVVSFLREFFEKGYKCIVKYGIIVMVFVSTWGCVSLAYRYHSEQYQKNPEWVEYLEWDGKLSKLLDGFFPYYEDDWQLYEELGISVSDLRYYEAWNTADTEALNVENMSRLIAAKDAYWVSKRTKLVEFWDLFPMAFTQISVFPYCILLFVIVFAQSKKQDYLAYLLQIGVVFGAYLYLYIQGRFLYNRVDVVAWLGAIIAILYMWEPSYGYKFQSEKVKKYLLAAAQVCVVVYLCFTCSDMFRWNYDSRTEDNTLAREIDIKADKEHLYLCTINLFGTSVTWDPFYVAEEG
ncbi:MAG: hypothetical protein IKB01_11065, partial [Lachnospiraceae bacterium]|nr:hypothetical protein [Lachnospiraceae bacterium]